VRALQLRVAVIVMVLLAAGVALAQEAPPQPTPTASPSPPVDPPQAATGGGASQTSNYFNPSVSVIGNFIAVGGTNEVENRPSMSLEESELGLQAVVDPYARADFFISFSDEEVAVEEGFLTFTALPWDLLVKVGRMKLAFGKINSLHPHVWPWADSPLILDDLLGGAEGWNGDGVSLAKLIPFGETFSELTLQIVDGDGGPFAAPKRSDFAYNAHYRLFCDLSDSTNLDLGLSYAFGHNGVAADTTTRIGALDFTLRWKPLQQGNYRSFILRGELFNSRREQDGGTQDALGWYLAGDYQLAKRWFTGARVEAAEHADDASVRDTGQALTLTFWPSEFSQLRGELRRRCYGGPNSASAGTYTANEVLLQLQFAIGAHGAHPF
jgi:hypothetical protein